MSGGRWLSLAVALIAATTVAVVLWPRTPDSDVISRGLPMPQRGAVAAEFAPDGHPVWVIGHNDGSILVLDALSTHVPFGVHKPTWFCPAAGTFDDPFHGSRYDLFGDVVFGPAPIGLRQYNFEVDADEMLILGELHEGRLAARGGDPSFSSPQACAADEALVHDYATLPEAGSPREAEGSADGWHRLHGTLIPEPATRSVLLCPDGAADDDCASIELPGMEHLTATPDERAQASIEGWADTGWLVHVVDGRIVEVSLLLD